jgi:hypothetical protein
MPLSNNKRKNNISRNKIIDTKESVKKRINFLIDSIYQKTGVKIDRKSNILNKKDFGFLYPQQLLASLKVINIMIDAKNGLRSRFIIINSEPQSGKSGTQANVGWLLEFYDGIRDFLGLTFDSSIFITSMSDKANIEQLKYDFFKICGSRSDKKMLISNIFHNPDMINDLRKKNKKRLRNAIVFHDESHLATFNISVVNKFLQNYGIGLNGLSNDDMIKNNLFYISVSATPYEEIIANNVNISRKNIVVLHVGEGYKGVKYFKENGLLKQAFPITSETTEKLKTILKTKYNQNKYCIVRLNSRNNVNTNDIVPEGWDHITYYQKDTYNINDVLSKTPTRPTIIFIKNKMKQSFQLKTKNISMMFDRVLSKTNENRTAMIIQGLIGRASGYNKPDIDIYTDLVNIDYHIQYMNNEYVPSTSNIIRKNIYSDYTQLVLIKLDMSNEYDELIYEEFLSFSNRSMEPSYMRDLLKSVTDISVIDGYEYNSRYLWSKDKKTYDMYIPPAYASIETDDGVTDKKYMREENKYNDGDKIFSIHIDTENKNIFLAYKTIQVNRNVIDMVDDVKDISVYHTSNSIKEHSLDKIHRKSNIVVEGYLLDNNKIRIFLEDGRIVLQKDTICSIKNYNNSGINIIDNILQEDILLDISNDKEHNNSIVEMLSELVSSGSKFMSTEKMTFSELLNIYLDTIEYKTH